MISGILHRHLPGVPVISYYLSPFPEGDREATREHLLMGVCVWLETASEMLQLLKYDPLNPWRLEPGKQERLRWWLSL